MTKRDWAILGCRILAVYFFVQGLSLLVRVYGVVSPLTGAPEQVSADAWQRVCAMLLQAAVVVASGSLLWWLAPGLGGRPAHAQAESFPSRGVDCRGAMELAFFLLGTYLLVKGLTDVPMFVYGAIWWSKQGVDWWSQLVGRLEILALAVWGLCLMVAARRLAALATRSALPSARSPTGNPEQVAELEGRLARSRGLILAVAAAAVFVVGLVLALGIWLSGEMSNPF